MASEFKNTEKFVRKYGKEVEAEIKNRLLSFGKKASGKLYKSIRADVREEKAGFIVQFQMEDYGLYVDGGVKGHGKPEGFKGKNKPVVTTGKFRFGSKMPLDNKSIKDWLRIKGIPKKESFAVRRSIWIFGIAPTNFFSIPVKRNEKRLQAGIEKNMALDFEQIIAKEFKKK